MQVAVGRACGKAILCGEHAVVYGRPAIGVPLMNIYAEAQVREGTGGVAIVAEDIDQAWMLEELKPDRPRAPFAGRRHGRSQRNQSRGRRGARRLGARATTP